jgi:hypothetical protein
MMGEGYLFARIDDEIMRCESRLNLLRAADATRPTLGTVVVYAVDRMDPPLSWDMDGSRGMINGMNYSHFVVSETDNTPFTPAFSTGFRFMQPVRFEFVKNLQNNNQKKIKVWFHIYYSREIDHKTFYLVEGQ